MKSKINLLEFIAFIAVIGFTFTGCVENTEEPKCPPHKWGNNVVTASTCVDAGYTTQTCSVCSETQKINLTIATSQHTWGGNVVIAPTCVDEGYTTQTCSKCPETRLINPTSATTTAHTWGGDVVTVSTCEDAGYITQTCSICPETRQINPTAATGHTSWGNNVITAPTCVEAGYTTQTCSECPETRQINPTAAGHTWGNNVITAPTCVEAGYTTQTCSLCPETRQINPIAAGHVWGSDAVIAPTCGSAGYTMQTCSKCSETRQINPISATGLHNYLNNICTLCNKAFMEMVQIPAGTFMMGSPSTELDRFSDETRHQVTLTKSFWMGKYEVTQEQYQTVMGVNPSYFHGRSGREPTPGEVQNRRPVETVTWYDAVEFCNKLSVKEGLTQVYTITLRTPATGYPIISATVTVNWNANGYRLPTEAEWEYACRAGTTTAYNTGNTITDNTSWYDANSSDRTHEVGKKPANAWGLYDMHGNVWEWCWDWYDDYSSESQTDPKGAASSYLGNRVLRGGSWLSYGRLFRSASRGYNYPNSRYDDNGFRVVRQ